MSCIKKADRRLLLSTVNTSATARVSTLFRKCANKRTQADWTQLHMKGWLSHHQDDDCISATLRPLDRFNISTFCRRINGKNFLLRPGMLVWIFSVHVGAASAFFHMQLASHSYNNQEFSKDASPQCVMSCCFDLRSVLQLSKWKIALCGAPRFPN